MVKVGNIKVTVKCGGEARPEYDPPLRWALDPYAAIDDYKNNPMGCHTFIEASYELPCSYPRETHEHDPYGIPIKQNYHVTPYTLTIENTSGMNYAIKVVVDGTQVSKVFCGAGKTVNVR